MPRSWCKFCEEHHEKSTCEVRKSVRDKIFGKRPETTIDVLDFTKPPLLGINPMIPILGINHMIPKTNMILPTIILAQAHSH
jgi:hypothetical protein